MKIKDYLTPEQTKYFAEKSNLQAFFVLLTNWTGVFALFALVALWTNPLTIFLAVVLLGGRMLGLAVVMHECGHHTFFHSSALNRFAGQWLAAAPTFNNLDAFATEHKIHHQKAGTQEDPNLGNYRSYPVSKASFKRKLTRDITGQTGFKLVGFVVTSALGIFNPEKRAFAISALRILWSQLVLAIVVGMLFTPWMYLVWLAAVMTSFMVVVRIRQVAEHGGVPELFGDDVRDNTRTTIPTWWERMVLAPNYVNYHVEHHFMSSVPCYKLKELHDLLQSKGAYVDMHIPQSYLQVIREVVVPDDKVAV